MNGPPPPPPPPPDPSNSLTGASTPAKEELDDRGRLFEGYLDGTLTDAERSRFDALAAADPNLIEALDLQKDIDRSIRRMFPAPAVRPRTASDSADTAHRLPRAGAAGGAPQARRTNWLRVAAIVAIGVIGVLIATRLNRPELMPPEVAYANHVRDHWAPYWTCENDEQFAKVGRERGTALLVHPKEGLTLVGWTFRGPVLSPNTADHPGTAVLLTTVGDDKVMVLMDGASSDRRLSVPSESGLHVFKRTVGRVVLYEISPREHEEVLPQFYEAGSK